MTQPGEDGLPVVKRDAVRLVVLDAELHVLLLHIQDLSDPTFGTSWELPGGGRLDAETVAETAVRELREECGFTVDPGAVGPPRWWRVASYRYRSYRRVQREVVAEVRLDAITPPVGAQHRVGTEIVDHIGFRWWPVHEIRHSDARFYPRSLPTALPRFLSGEALSEPLEYWP